MPSDFSREFSDDASIPDRLSSKPSLTIAQAEEISGQCYGLFGTATELTGETDQNFLIETPAQKFVLKISSPHVGRELLEFENQALRLAEAIIDFDSPCLIKSIDNQVIVTVSGIDENNSKFLIRCISFVPGVPLAKFQPHSADLLAELGRSLALLNDALSRLDQNVAAKRELHWDLANAPAIVRDQVERLSADQQSMLKKLLANFESVEERVQSMPQGVIHNDANDYNWLIHVAEGADVATVGIIDFGDAVYSTKLNDLAICCAYLMLDKQNSIEALCAVARGYHEIQPLNDTEFSVLFPLACMRLAQSVCIAAQQKQMRPDDAYITISEKPAWQAIERLCKLDPVDVCESIRVSCSGASSGGYSTERDAILGLREKHISPSLSLSYETPLQIVSGKGQYLFDENGTTYLDCVNNVCHVGHGHPAVVAAIADQARVLNTNTRYLHPNIVKLAERLTQTLPAPLEVCFFVNSGSEANDLALRLAAAKTGNRDVFAIDHGYHGHTKSLIDISPYKFNRAGGEGKPDHVHVLPMPDGFRGEFRHEDSDFAKKYAAQAVDAIEKFVGSGGNVSAFFAEAILSCGGQMPLPAGYLEATYRAIRAGGGVCVADEVQTGFGRVGQHYWAFQLQGVVPDIVTVGKPFGNGHPLAAVVTTREIADTFNNGMEYFNTFGGNPVSCAAGLAVMKVIEKEELQKRALDLGGRLIEMLKEVQSRYPDRLGDVRGHGLFVGVELVADMQSRKPDPELAAKVKQEMVRQKILLSTDGPDENVIKIKPPLVFDEANVDRLVANLDKVLSGLT